MTVYVDELIFINMFVTFFLLLTASVISKSRIRPLRMFFACTAGGIYSLIIFAVFLPAWVKAVMRVAVCFAILLIADNFNTIRSFMKRVTAFLITNFLFAGLMLCVNFIAKPKSVIYSAGAVYYDIGLTYIIVLTVISYLTAVILSRLTASSVQTQYMCGVTVFIRGKQVSGRAFLDTGNSMCDSFSGKPVLLTDESFIENIVPEDVRLFLTDISSDMGKFTKEWRTAIRLFPYGSIGGSGFLPSVRSDKVILTLEGGEIQIPSVYIAVSKNRISSGEYEVILPNTFAQYFNGRGKNERLHRKTEKYIS